MTKFMQSVLWDDASKIMFLKRVMSNDFIFMLYKVTNL